MATVALVSPRSQTEPISISSTSTDPSILDGDTTTPKASPTLSYRSPPYFKTDIFASNQFRSNDADYNHDDFSSTAPVTPPIYSPSIGSTSVHSSSSLVSNALNGYPLQASASNASTGTLLQSRSMSIQSLVSIGTSTTVESATDEDKDSSIVFAEDPDVRMAAEALGELRADFKQSPSISVSSPPPPAEPFIDLIGGAHPLIGHAMNASRSVYRGAQNYSPRFKAGAEMVERAAAPMSSVVSFAARTTGVEGVLRRGLEARQPDKAKKRRKTSVASVSTTATDMDVDNIEDNTLAHKNNLGNSNNNSELITTSENWQRRLILNTAGMGAALSEESLKSLKYCFDWLKWANNHLDTVIITLRSLLDEWDHHHHAARSNLDDGGKDLSNGTNNMQLLTQQEALQQRINGLKAEVVTTLKRVVDIVSTYAGGALPQHARLYVKACITSLPRRFASIAQQESGTDPSNALTLQRDTNRRVLVLAKEGLDMLHQVAGIVNGTLARAEEWCERLGKRRPSMQMSETDGESSIGWGDREGMERLLRAASVHGEGSESVTA